ncbi:hypothetical protein [Pseudomonas sp. BN515]|nr:hypothetical protein [Pseudomonas sp. BN515]
MKTFTRLALATALPLAMQVASAADLSFYRMQGPLTEIDAQEDGQ